MNIEDAQLATLLTSANLQDLSPLGSGFRRQEDLLEGVMPGSRSPAQEYEVRREPFMFGTGTSNQFDSSEQLSAVGPKYKPSVPETNGQTNNPASEAASVRPSTFQQAQSRSIPRVPVDSAAPVNRTVPLRFLTRATDNSFAVVDRRASNYELDGYEILTYQWGASSPPYSCGIRGVSWDVTISAAKIHAIQMFMVASGTQRLWVDSLVSGRR